MILPHVGLEGVVGVVAALAVLALQQVRLVLEDQAGVCELLFQVEVHILAGLLVHGGSAVQFDPLQVFQDGSRVEIPRANTGELVEQMLRESIVAKLLELGCHHLSQFSLC